MGAPGDDVDMALPAGERLVVKVDDGAELAVHLVDGGKRTVVLAHGWSSSMAMWAPVARRLHAAGHRVVLFDQRGHGASTFGGGHPTLSSLATPHRRLPLVTPARLGGDLATVLRELEVHDAVLVGHSMGGFSVLAYAADSPVDLRCRMRGMVLVSTAAHRPGFGPLDRVGARLLGGRLSSWTMRRGQLGRAWVRVVFGRRPRREHLETVRKTFVATPRLVRAGCFAGLAGMDMRADLGKADVPAAVLVGSRDRMLPSRLSRTLVAALPEARLEVVPKAGHMLPLETPDLVADRIADLAE